MDSNHANKKSLVDYDPPLMPGAILFIVFTIIKLIVTVNKNNMIIHFGIKAYRGINNFITILIAVAFVITIVAVVVLLIKIGAMKKDPENKPQPRPNAILSIDKEMSADCIRDILTSAVEQHHHALPIGIINRINSCASLMDEMDKYQQKLANLLNNNGADGLSDTEEILEKVEQCICKNVRKVINYISVADFGNEKDVMNIKERLDTCIEDSQNQLNQVKDFLFAMAEFLNKQGDDDTASETMEIYRDLILKSINNEDGI